MTKDNEYIPKQLIIPKLADILEGKDTELDATQLTYEARRITAG